MYEDFESQYRGRMRVLDLASQARQDGITLAFQRHYPLGWEMAGALFPAPVAIGLSLLGQKAGLPIWASIPMALVAGIAILLVCMKRNDQARQRRQDILDDDVALTALGLEPAGGIGSLPVELVPFADGDDAIRALLSAHLADLHLTESQTELWNQFVAEGYTGTIAELTAAARSLG